MKGQSSIEFLIIIGIALVLSAPFILAAQDSIINFSMGSNDIEFQSSLDELGYAVTTVAESGEKTARTVELEIPSNIEEVYVQDQALVFEMDRGSRKTNFTQTFPVSTNVDEQIIDSDQSIRTLKLESWSGDVNITTMN